MGNGGRTQSCPGCRADNPEDSRFCRRCGALLPAAHETLPYPTPTPVASTPVPSSGPHFPPGAAFGERYRIIEEVGSGGMGRVYKAEDMELGTTVALKMIRPELAADPAVIERFKTEVRLARAISHDNVVRIHDLGEIGGVKYVSMDFIKGEDLKSLIRLSGALSVDTALKIALQAGEALRAAHRKNIVHQDLKPQNIMIEADGRVIVTDFGLAALRASGGEPGVPAGAVGTPLYSSPEQARGAPADPRSDIYSFGVALYEMLTGREPFRAATAAELARKHESEHPTAPTRLNPAVPAAFEKIVLKCMAKKREDRYQSLDDLLAELKKLGAPGGVRSVGRLGPKLLWIVPSAIALIILAAFAVRTFVPKDRSGADAMVRSPLRRVSIAVLDAVNYTGDASLDYLRATIRYQLSIDLGQSRYLGVLSDDRVNEILGDAGRPDSERQPKDVLDRIAEKEDVEYFVLPGFARVGDRFRLSAKVYRAQANLILDTVSVDGQDLFVMVDTLTRQLKTVLRLSESEIASDYDRELTQISTTSLDALRNYMDGKRLYLEGRFSESNLSLSKAVAADPNFALAYKKMSENFNYQGDIAQSTIMIGRALALLDHVSERDRYLIQGYASSFLDESPEKARAIYRKLLELYPNDEEGRILLGSIARNLELWDEAEREFEEVLDLNPKSELAVENLAYINSGLARYDKAIGLVRSHQALFPRSDLLAWRLGLLHMASGRFDAAEREIERPLKSDPSNAYGLELQGNILQLKDDLEGARAVYGRLRSAPTPFAACLGRFWTAQVDLQCGRFRNARDQCLSGLDLAEKSGRSPDILKFRLLQSQVELGLGRWAEAAEAAKTAAEIASKILYHSERKTALMFNGLALTGAGRLAEARAAAGNLRELIDRTGCPAHARYLYALQAALALKDGDATEAVEWQDKAVALLSGQIDNYDDHAFFVSGLARVLEAAGLPERALAAYERLASLTTGRLRWGCLYAPGFYKMGALHEGQGETDKAAVAYRRFLMYWDRADGDFPEPQRAKARLKALGAS